MSVLHRQLFQFLLAALAAAVATAETAPAQSKVPVFGVRSALVVLSATAVDGKGRPVRNLTPQELSVLEEGRPQKLVRFSQAADLGCRVLLLVDASGSMNAKAKTATGLLAAQTLVRAFDVKDEVALAGFDSRYFGLVPFTRQREPLFKGFEELKPFGTTALHDALDQAAHDIASHGEGRRAIVVITDGVDTASAKTPEEVIARSRALDVPIYAITVVSPLDDPESSIYTGKERATAHDEGRRQLQLYAGMSGGAAFTVSDLRGLQEAAQSIAGELKHQYRLGYDPPEGPSRFRRIEVRTTRKGVVIRTRSGYVPPS